MIPYNLVKSAYEAPAAYAAPAAVVVDAYATAGEPVNTHVIQPAPAAEMPATVAKALYLPWLLGDPASNSSFLHFTALGLCHKMCQEINFYGNAMRISKCEAIFIIYSNKFH